VGVDATPATVTIADNETATVTITATDNAASETPVDTGLFTVNLGTVNNTGAAITVNYAVSGTAGAGDYTALTGSVLIANGASSATINVAGIVDDLLLEGAETVTVTLLNTGTPGVGVDATPATVTIADNETPSADLSVTTSGDETGPVDIVFTVTLSMVNSTGAAITFDLASIGGSAASGLDYAAIPGGAQISIANGATTGTYTVTVNDDALVEGIETLQAQISNPSLAALTIGTGTATATITDNDTGSTAPSLQNNAWTIINGGTLSVTPTNVSATDPDTPVNTLVFNVVSVTNGYFEYAASPGVAVTTFTQQQIANGEVRFVHNGSGAPPSFTLYVSDGASNVGPAAANITFVGAGIGTPAPTPGGGGGGGTTVTDPTLPPTGPTGTTGLPPTTLATFFRPGGGGEEGDGDGVNFIEVRPVPAGLVVTDRVATPESLIPPIRVQADVIDTTTRRPELEIEPIRAEMQVIPTRYDLDLSEEERQRIEVVLNSVRITGLALSVGAVWWAARAAGLVASLLASTPAWRHVDPLPVLGRDEEEEEEWDESAEDQDKKDDEHRAAWVLEGESRL
jgi:hypothetical protein